jgi:Tol biopolymer transport system component
MSARRDSFVRRFNWTALCVVTAGVAMIHVASIAPRGAETTTSEIPTLRADAERLARSDSLRDPREVHLRNVRQITFGGENAEAYFSRDGRWLTFQSTRDGYPCDQQYVTRADGSDLRRISTGGGRTTCGYWYPDGSRVLFSSTHLADAACPPRPDYSHGYVWALYPTFDIVSVKPDGSDLVPLTQSAGYDAESVISPDGRHVVFTSTRSGDPEIYVMDIDGSNVRRLTHAKGYDGGPWWSPDGKWITYRAYHPRTPPEVSDYDSLMAQNLIRPTVLEIYIMRADGSHTKQVTHLNAASFCPFFLPGGKHILFASNAGDPKGRNFDLYTIGVNGKNLERITYNETFDAFPMLSADGTTIVWGSNRHNGGTHDTNVFVADWVK